MKRFVSLLVVLGAMACTPETPPPRVAVTNEGTVDESDKVADAFLQALKAEDYAKAASRFDGAIKAAVPEKKLAETWSATTTKLGPLLSWTITGRRPAKGNELRVVRLKLERGEIDATIGVAPSSHAIAAFFLRPVPKPTPSAPYVDAAAFRSENVSIGAKPFVLEGTLTLPLKGKGRLPAAILVHGSGAHDRDESIAPNKPFKDLAEGLSSRGIAVLRYDKRTFTYGSELTNAISIEDEVVADAISAVKVLKARPEIDPARVFVIGHSIGAQLAPEIAVRSSPVAGAVLMSPLGRAPWDALVAQLKYVGAPADTIAEAERSAALLNAGKLGAGTLIGVPGAYWQDLAAHDGIAMTRRLERPVLLLHGDRDYQITDEDIAIWKRGLDSKADLEVANIPGANHLFIVGTGKPGPAEYQTPGHVDLGAIEKIAAFIARVN